jgi:hypothetical protein
MAKLPTFTHNKRPLTKVSEYPTLEENTYQEQSSNDNFNPFLEDGKRTLKIDDDLRKRLMVSMNQDINCIDEDSYNAHGYKDA